MRRATTIKAASCSRPARPRKALGSCAQSKLTSTVSPRESENLGILESLMQAMQAVVVKDFMRCDDICEIVAKYPPLTTEAAEFVIRGSLLGIGKR